MFQRILVAADPSPARHSVVRLAGDMARLTGAKVHVLHVAASAATLGAVVTLEDDVEAKALLDEAVTALRDTGVEAEGTVVNALTQQIAGTISSAAQEWQADLIIVGPHHRGSLEAFLNPRVSDAVAHSSRVAVLLAPDDDADTQR
ncbi:universal stress protein [Streptomyces sp. VRA16 Mangrove soil]|uniref:universal stress protein n=1 Tax=Streptomyces sp. VRA16 Mangrove soil TaxID=2817434 RepID=UPI001A9D57C9|nr:universal stress protein [Streptomyces sp. VRA16 Mangrove soil]MBO1332671.1 universal stress protein [Streptomyces sp. VRA16 Mangrove soil]